MAVYVNTNYSALQGQRYLGNVQNSLTTTYQRLSSGMRINSAKDDAAGLQIADRLTSQINGLNQGNRNAADGIALAQTVEAGMDEISGMLQKLRTLTVQAANGTNTKEDRAALSKEASALATEINRIATQTTFAGKKVLNGKGDDSILGPAGNAGGGNGQNGTAGKAGDTGTLTLQVGSNKGDIISFDLQSVMFSKLTGKADDLIKAGTDKVFGTNDTTGFVTVTFTKANFADQTAKDGIGSVIELMDKAIATVDGMRADLGAIQNRLESSIRNQSNVAANEADARSRIRDADFAEESANLSQQSIIQQAAASMLMQANTRPQLGLSLLG
ncbi:flagellin [Anaerobiospirillum succiniciproducens]|uniref:flagellin N-terminal helical domain-containing protein n=2 Tax=Anaerobiospirillum succiniciproducens TaxID=13335 RepID=UPI0004185FD3|nr:flagellin [Anaerobiospirillum succiniciproducens]